jgi:phosphoglycolate phosphatase-like HAD superfamily hydrolase
VVDVDCLVGRVDGFLLDFDGPVCDLFPPGSGSTIGDRAREPLESAGVVIPEGVARTVEHLVVLGFAAVQAPGVLEEVERAAIEGEVEAARSAPITAGVREFLDGCARTDRPVVIVSNNAAAAVELFLERHDLTHLITGVLGRPYARPELMKPDPFLAAPAIALLDRPRCCMIGDGPSDIEFSRRAGLTSIAYAKSPRHEARLRSSGPDAVITAMTALADCL